MIRAKPNVQGGELPPRAEKIVNLWAEAVAEIMDYLQSPETPDDIMQMMFELPVASACAIHAPFVHMSGNVRMMKKRLMARFEDMLTETLVQLAADQRFEEEIAKGRQPS